jgi:hypothetical protein
VIHLPQAKAIQIDREGYVFALYTFIDDGFGYAEIIVIRDE